VDLPIEQGEHIKSIEIKSGATPTPVFFKNLDRFDITCNHKSSQYLVYGGEQSQQRRKTRLVSWRELLSII